MDNQILRGYMKVNDKKIKHDEGKARWDLLPWDGCSAIVDVLTFGAQKYTDRSWETGINYTRVYAALQRHMIAWFQEGEDNDPESGLPHLAHAACCLLFLLSFSVRGRTDLDDRPTIITHKEGDYYYDDKIIKAAEKRSRKKKD